MEKMRQWSILTAVGVVAVLALGWFLLVSPQRSHAADLRTQAASQQSANATLQSQVNQLEQQKKGLPAQQRLLDQIATKIPGDPQLPALIRQLSAAAQGANVDLVSLSPGAPALATATSAPAASSLTAGAASHASAASTLAQIPVTLQVTGSYFNVESFFAAVEKLKRAMLVTGFALTPGGGTSSAGSSSGGSASAQVPGTLTGQITAMVFESPTATAPTQVTPVAPVAPAK